MEDISQIHANTGTLRVDFMKKAITLISLILCGCATPSTGPVPTGAALIQPGTDITCFEGYVLRVEAREGSELRGVRLEIGPESVITARRGTVSEGPEEGSLLLTLPGARSEIGGQHGPRGDFEAVLRK